MWTKTKKPEGFGFGAGAGGSAPPKDLTKELPQIEGELDKIDDALEKAALEIVAEQRRIAAELRCRCL